MAEHHFQHEGWECIPRTFPCWRWTSRIAPSAVKFGCAFNVVPTCWHPLRLRRGTTPSPTSSRRRRVVFGVGRGYHSREVETFGNPMLDAEANRELFEEQVEVILKGAARGVLRAPGQALHHSARGARIAATPSARSRWCRGRYVSRWTCGKPIVSGGARGLEFMARHGHQGFISATGGGAGAALGSRPSGSVGRRHGRDRALGEDLILGFRLCLDDTVEGAIRSARPLLRGARQGDGAARHCCATARSTPRPVGARLQPSRHHTPRSRTACATAPGSAVPRGDVVAAISRMLEAKYPGLDHVMLGWAIGGAARDDGGAARAVRRGSCCPAFSR
jgi:hypothetical protein